MITSSEQLAEWTQRGREVGYIALDTEFVWERTYYPRLGVVQVGLSESECGLIDAVALPGLEPLGELLADPSIVKILHDVQQDLTILRRATGAHPRNVFDTRLVGGLVGTSSTLSLEALLQQVLGVTLTGTATRSDWLRRPLSEKQVAYALDDVRHLPAARDRLLQRVGDLGRQEWVREELAAYGDPTLYDDPDPRAQFTRVKGTSRLSSRKLAVLREVTAWREQEARRRDLPRQHVVPDKALVDAAVRTPKSLQALSRIKGAPGEGRAGGAMLEAIERGMSADGRDLPRVPERPEEDETLGARVDFLLAYMKGKSLSQAVDPALVATRSDVTALARNGAGSAPDHHRLLRGWRRELVGEELLRLQAGELAVTLDPETGLPDLA